VLPGAAGQSNVMLRINFASGPAWADWGYAFDNITIFEPSTPATSSSTQTDSDPSSVGDEPLISEEDDSSLIIYIVAAIGGFLLIVAVIVVAVIVVKRKRKQQEHVFLRNSEIANSSDQSVELQSKPSLEQPSRERASYQPFPAHPG
jgi:hypothetical protein